MSQTHGDGSRKDAPVQPLVEDWRESRTVASLAWILGCTAFAVPFFLYWGTQDRKCSLVHRHARAALRVWIIATIVAFWMLAVDSERGTITYGPWAIGSIAGYFSFALVSSVLGVRGLARGWVPFAKNRRIQVPGDVACSSSTTKVLPSARILLTMSWWGGLIAGPVPALVIYSTSRAAPASPIARSSSAAVKMWAGMILIWIPVFVLDQALRGGEPGAVALGVFGGLAALLVLSAVAGSIWASRLARGGMELKSGPSEPPSVTT